ncbi:MAG: hypothetical protein NC216_05640, partial [Bacteroides sp.]|nr:hypothetical protein [Bacteroides sp.]
ATPSASARHYRIGSAKGSLSEYSNGYAQSSSRLAKLTVAGRCQCLGAMGDNWSATVTGLSIAGGYGVFSFS